jgi:hypothetical protein
VLWDLFHLQRKMLLKPSGIIRKTNRSELWVKLTA